MAYIPKTGISNTSTIDAEHITRIIDALDGTATTEVSASGQFSGSHSGSFLGDGSGLTGVTGEWDGTHNGNAQITGSLVVTANVTASGAISASNFTGTTSGTNTGDQDLSSYVINSATASLAVTGSNVLFGNVTASGNISASSAIYAGNGLYINNKLALDGSGTTLILNANSALTSGTSINRVSAPLPVKLNGNVTASGNISSSGTLIANAGTFTSLTNVSTTHVTASGNISSSGHVIGTSFAANTPGAGISAIDMSVTGRMDLNPNNSVTVRLTDSLVTLNKNTFIQGNATASGNISSSFTSASSGPGGVPTVSGFEIAAHRYITKTQTVAAAGNNQDTAAQISPDAAVVFTTSADNTKGVKLPLTTLVELGTTITIHNSVTNKTLEIYPADGEVLLPNLSTNGPATVLASGTFMCTKSADTRWVAWICFGAT